MINRQKGYPNGCPFYVLVQKFTTEVPYDVVHLAFIPLKWGASSQAFQIP